MTRDQIKDLLDRLQFDFRSRVPLLLQTEAAECGLACIAMICGIFTKM